MSAATARGRRRGFVVVDASGTIRAWEGHAAELTGHSEEAAVGQSLDLIVPADYRERHWAGFRRAIETGVAGAEGFGASIPVQCADGEVRRFPARFTLIRDAFGNVAAAAAVIAEARADDEALFEL